MYICICIYIYSCKTQLGCRSGARPRARASAKARVVAMGQQVQAVQGNTGKEATKVMKAATVEAQEEEVVPFVACDSSDDEPWSISDDQLQQLQQQRQLQQRHCEPFPDPPCCDQFKAERDIGGFSQIPPWQPWKEELYDESQMRFVKRCAADDNE